MGPTQAPDDSRKALPNTTKARCAASERTRQFRSARRELQLDQTRKARPSIASPSISQTLRSARKRSKNDSKSSPVIGICLGVTDGFFLRSDPAAAEAFRVADRPRASHHDSQESSQVQSLRRPRPRSHSHALGPGAVTGRWSARRDV